MSFLLEGASADIKNMNLRIEQHGEGEVLAVDYKFESELEIDDVAKLTDIGKTVLGSFYDGKGQLTEFGVKELKVDAAFTGYRTKIQWGLQREVNAPQSAVKVTQLKALPFRRFKTTFSARFNTKPEELGELGEILLTRNVTVTIADNQQSLPLADGEHAANAA